LRAKTPRNRIVVVGGAGAMGRITVRDLAETAPRAVDIVVADRDRAAARRLAAAMPRRVTAMEVDAASPASLARALKGAVVVVNACHHDFNLRVMDAALAAGSHYCDLGGLFHVTRRQLARDAQFRRAGLLAVCGMGSAPGVVNVMARAAAEGLDRVREIHVAVGTRDRTPRRGTSLLDTSYSIQTVLDEASQPAALFTRGALWFVEPLSRAEPVRFPAPVGLQHPACTLHSELATLPQSFRGRGVREVSFKIAFPGDLADRLRFVRALGLTSSDPIEVRGRTLVPRDLLLALLAAAPRPVAVGPRDEYEVLRVTVRGRQGRRAVDIVLDCHVPGMPSWGIGVDIDTGAPPSIVAQMLAAGALDARGVLPPERAIPPQPFFRELRRRGMRIVKRRKHAGGR
jgi:saccharopine dehydrogenase-like NADP-dependent oxidoreductase